MPRKYGTGFGGFICKIVTFDHVLFRDMRDICAQKNKANRTSWLSKVWVGLHSIHTNIIVRGMEPLSTCMANIVYDLRDTPVQGPL